MTRADLAVIADLIPSGSRVLDLGCGNGDLLALRLQLADAVGQLRRVDHLFNGGQRRVEVIEVSGHVGIHALHCSERVSADFGRGRAGHGGPGGAARVNGSSRTGPHARSGAACTMGP